MITASKLGDIIEVKNILKTGNFSVNQTNNIGNIYKKKIKEISVTEAVTLRLVKIIYIIY